VARRGTFVSLLVAGNKTFLFVLVQKSVLCLYVPARIFNSAVHTDNILCRQSALKFVRQETWMTRDTSDFFNALLDGKHKAKYN